MIKMYKTFVLSLIFWALSASVYAQQCNVIYVTPGGAGSGAAGTKANPASLTYGLTLTGGAASRVWLAFGVYNISQPIQLASNITIEGGFDPVTWIKSNATPSIIHKDNTNVIPGANALVALAGGSISGFRLQDLTIQVDDALGASVSDYGIYLNGCSNYNIVRCIVTSGAGAPGPIGAPGALGAPGSPGGDGTAGAAEPNPTTAGAGGAGGNAGGNGGVTNSYNPGGAGNGIAGSGVGGGAAGGGGSGPGCSAGCFFGPPGCSGNPGTAGGAGGAGAAGTAGAIGPAGTYGGLGYYIPGAAGGNGGTGVAGAGGGGGGQGGGQQENGSDDHGGSGGGGGGGGFGGGGGTGGLGGGGSFAVFLYNNAAGGSIVDCQLTAGAGGAGGAGGVGAGGGAGGAGGAGGGPNPVCGSGNTVGGAGGAGGAGGPGGVGGAGANGPSANLMEQGTGGQTAVTQQNITNVPGNPPVINVLNYGCTNAQVTFASPGAGAWTFGAGTPATGNGAGPINVLYSSTGRQTIGFAGTTFTDFVDIFTAQNTSNTITNNPNPIIAGCPQTFSTSIAGGTLYQWDFGPSALPPVASGPALTTTQLIFTAAGTFTVHLFVTTTCCGIVEDSLIVTVQPNTLNISLIPTSPDTVCYGSPIDFVAQPGSYLTYSFYVNDTLQASNGNTFIANNLQPGDSVTVFGFNGTCYTNPSASNYPLIYPVPSAATVTNNLLVDTICSGDTVTFTASPATYFSYAFYNGGSLQQTGPSNMWTTNQLGNGNAVHVTVTNQFGCINTNSNIDSIYVKQTPSVFDAPPAPVICQGNSLTIDATSNPLVLDNYDFYVNNVLVQSSTAGSFTSSTFNNQDSIVVRGSLNGCTSSFTNPTIFVTVHPNPTATLSSSVPGDSICAGQPITFTVAPSGYAKYVFFNGAAVAQDGTSSTYTTNSLTNGSTITAVDTNLNCPSVPSNAITITVSPLPVVSAGSNPPAECITAAASALVGFSPNGGAWTGQGITNPAGNFDPAIAGSGVHELTYTYTDPNSGCTASDSIVFTVNPLPVITLTPPAFNICQNQSAQLNASGGSTYTWSPATGLSNPNISNPVATPAATTVYDLTVTDNNLCTDTSSITVIISPKPTAGFSTLAVCNGVPSVFTNASAPAAGNTYFWNFGDGNTSTNDNPTHTYAIADSFNVMLIAQLGNCFDTAQNVAPVFPAAVANFDAFPLVGYNDAGSSIHFNNLSANSNIWLWDFGDQASSTIASPSHFYQKPGLYTISLTANNQFGCLDSLVKPHYIEIFEAPKIFIPNVFSPNGDGNNDLLQVKVTITKYFDFTIFDRIGEKVYESYDQNSGWDGNYKGDKAPMGVYAYHLKLVFEDNTTRDYKGTITLLR